MKYGMSNNESIPAMSAEERNAFAQSVATGRELVRQDGEDPERGPLVRLVCSVMKAARYGTPLYKEIETFYTAFSSHFKNEKEAKRYRLYHIVIGSTPSGMADLFDTEGEWSIAAKMRELAEKYHIGISQV